jgi:uncharacterized membrane protein YbhN (UPF0104 family)
MSESGQSGADNLADNGRVRRSFPTWLIWLSLAAALGAAAFLVPWHQVWAALLDANKRMLLIAVAICLTGVPVAVLQWLLLVPSRFRVPFARMFEIVALTVTARGSLPFLAGDASSVGLLVLRGGLTTGAAVLVLTLEQMFSGLGKVAMVCASLASASLPPAFVAAGISLVVMVVGLFVVMLAASHYGRLLHRLAALFPARVENWIRRLADLTDHLELLRHPLRASGVLALMTVKKVIEIAVTLSVANAVGIDLPLWNAVLVVTALDLIGAIPGPPSGLGLFEATAVFVYHALGVSPGLALAAAILQHAVYLGTDFFYGYAVLLAAAFRGKKATPAPPGP